MGTEAERTASVSVALCGSGGSGVMTAGNMLLDAAARAGLYGLMTRSMGPQIRGGEAAAMLRIAARPVDAHDDAFDLVIAVDWENVQRFAAEMPLRADSLIVTDPSGGEVPGAIAEKGARIAVLPLKDLARKIPGGRANMLALGAAGALIGLPTREIVAVIEKSLRKKDAAALKASVAAVELGATAAASLPALTRRVSAAPEARGPRWAISGNQAVGIGAIKGGIRFVAAYPITPATEILEWMAQALPKTGGTLVQAEDELSSINMAIGASFGGVAAMTATSGPGLSLMTESLGLAVSSETPVVVVDVMRCGPSTGIPTKSEQSDLNIALHGLHGDAPHLVLAPTSPGDCLRTTQWAVALAERLQAPAIVLSDQFIGQARAVIDPPAPCVHVAKRSVAEKPGKGYARYAITESGVSPMALPGTPGGQYTADGLEHSPRGTPSSQASDHHAQMEKRHRKLHDHVYGGEWADIEGDGEVAVVTWGSTSGVVREAAARMRAGGAAIRVVALRLLAPAQPERLRAALAGARRVYVIEQSQSAQFFRYLRAYYDLPCPAVSVHRAGPLLYRPGEIHARLTEGNRT